jgi:hypothetical protein
LYPRQTRAGIVPDDSIYGSQSGNSVFINADLPFDKPYQVPRTLTHELTHAAQYKQFPDDKRNDAHYGMRLPYEYRPGEELAREVATQAQSKVDKEILDDAQARMIADWKAGKGPKPWFMYDDVIARRKAREAADK